VLGAAGRVAFGFGVVVVLGFGVAVVLGLGVPGALAALGRGVEGVLIRARCEGKGGGAFGIVCDAAPSAGAGGGRLVGRAGGTSMLGFVSNSTSSTGNSIVGSRPSFFSFGSGTAGRLPSADRRLGRKG